jgi:hypothetical protein
MATNALPPPPLPPCLQIPLHASKGHPPRYQRRQVGCARLHTPPHLTGGRSHLAGGRSLCISIDNSCNAQHKNRVRLAAQCLEPSHLRSATTAFLHPDPETRGLSAMEVLRSIFSCFSHSCSRLASVSFTRHLFLNLLFVCELLRVFPCTYSNEPQAKKFPSH